MPYGWLSVEVMLLLFGTSPSGWVLRIAERAGLVETLARWLAPLFAQLMPACRAATRPWADDAELCRQRARPGQRGHAIGLKAMHSLQSLNPEPQTCHQRKSCSWCSTPVAHAAAVSIFMYRLQQASDPTLVFVPILLATSASTLVGLLTVAFVQRLPLWRPVVLAYLLLPLASALCGAGRFLSTLSAAALASLSSSPAT